MKEINVTCGCRIEHDNGKIDFIGGDTDNGLAYKDYDAWENNKGVIYISEYELEDIDNIDDLWTKEKWVRFVDDYIEQELSDDNVIIPNGFAEYIAECIFQECDWCELSTMLYETFDYDTILENLTEYINTHNL